MKSCCQSVWMFSPSIKATSLSTFAPPFVKMVVLSLSAKG
ncbi:hypothetical protein HMPREF1869_00027 [Bacteroidales bacterium KA00251]|nr:hypothetical protein HMPREF1869_00027 [Bacteroidales bacterium KA00251]